MAESKRHHFVPQSILRRFAVPGSESVWILDKPSGASFTSSILSTGMENGFNVVTIDGRRINFEHEFGDADGAMAGVHRRLVEARDLNALTADDRTTLADAAAVQLLRTKLVRTTLKFTTAALMADMARVGLVEGEPPSLDEQQARAIARNAFHDREGHRDSLAALDLLLVRPDDGEALWTSDNPIVRHNTQPYGDVGLTSPGVEVYWPIAPDLVVAFMCPTLRMRVEAGLALGDRLEEPVRSQCAELHRGYADGVPVLLGRGGTAAFLNELQVRGSSRFLYAQADDFGLARSVIAARPELKSVETMVAVGRMGEGPGPRARMPAGMHLVVYGRVDHHMVELESRTDTEWGMTVTLKEPKLVDMVMADLPWREVQVYEDRHQMRSMRELRVEVDRSAGNPTISIEHSFRLPTASPAHFG